MRLDLILLVGFAGPLAASPPSLDHYKSFHRSWASASTRLDSVIAELPTQGTVPPGASASTASNGNGNANGTVAVPDACSCDTCSCDPSCCGSKAPATSAASASASAGPVTSASTSAPPPAVVTATSTLTTSATPSSGDVESGSTSVSAASSTVNLRATTTTTTVTMTRPASTAAADPAFTTKGSHHHQAHTSNGEAHRSDDGWDSLDRELGSTRKSKLLRRHKSKKIKGSPLKDKEMEVRYLEGQSASLWKAAHSWGKVLQHYEAEVKQMSGMRGSVSVESAAMAEEVIDEMRLVLTHIKSVSDRAHLYARIQDKWLLDAKKELKIAQWEKKELEIAQWEKAAKEVHGLSHEEILRKEDFGKHASSHNLRARSETKDAGEHDKQKKEKQEKEKQVKEKQEKEKQEKEKQDKTAKHKDEKVHDNKKDNKTDATKEETAEKSDLHKYEDALYGSVGEQIRKKLGNDESKGRHSLTIEKGEKPAYMITKEFRVYKCDGEKGCKEDFGPVEEQAKDEDANAEKDAEKDEGKGKENEVEKKEEKDSWEEEDGPSLLADGDEAEQLKRLQQLYMQWRGMLVEAIRKDLDPILKNDKFPEDTQMASQHMKGDEKEQRKRLSLMYMNYRHMLLDKFTELLDPILHAKNQKTG